MREILLRISGILAVAFASFIFISAVQRDLKPFEYVKYPIENFLAWNETELSLSVSKYLWDYHSIDIIALAFLLVVATACCVSILSSREERRR